MHYSKLAAAATFVGLVAAADTYIMKVGYLIGGDVLSRRDGRVVSINPRDSALVITTKPGGDKADDDLFQLNPETGVLTYIYPSANGKTGAPMAPPAASLILGGTYKNTLTFSDPPAGQQHTINRQPVGIINPGQFKLVDTKDENWPYNVELEGKTFALCRYEREGSGEHKALSAWPKEEILPRGCDEAYIGLKKFEGQPPDNEEVDLDA